MRFRLRPSLTHCILLGLIAGTFFGVLAPRFASHLAILAQIFLRLIEMLIVPLVFSSLVMSIANRSARGSMQRVAIGSMAFFIVATVLAAVMGLGAAHAINPRLDAVPLTESAKSSFQPPPAATSSFLENLVPMSIIQVMFSNNLLGLVFFTVLFALALRASGSAGDPVYRGCSSLATVMFRLTGYVMWAAPFGVLGGIASTVSRFGLRGLIPYSSLLLVSYLSLGLFLVVLFIAVRLTAQVHLPSFVKSLSDVWLLAFSTASSAAVLPAAMEHLEEWGASRRVTSFVLPLGYSFNLTGPSLYLPLLTLFWAQINQISLSWHDQLFMLGYVLIVTRGIPTVPRGLFFVWGSVLAQFHLPPEGIIIMLGIDPLIDMARTLVNVVGNCLAVAAIDRWSNGAHQNRDENLASG
jgi:proton glutamate symport protein